MDYVSKKMNVFIASSAELKPERLELVDLLMDLNYEWVKRGVKFKPALWEYMDSSMQGGRKEDEYLAKLRTCEICIVMFWRTLGEYTVEELDVAVAEMIAGRLPKKVYVLFKEPADEITLDLSEFKKTFAWKYSNIPSDIFISNDELREKVTKLLTNKTLSPE